MIQLLFSLLFLIAIFLAISYHLHQRAIEDLNARVRYLEQVIANRLGGD